MPLPVHPCPSYLCSSDREHASWVFTVVFSIYCMHVRKDLHSSSECILDAHRCHVVFLDQNGSRFLVQSSREQSTPASQSRLCHTLLQTCASSPLSSLVARRPNHSPRVRLLARNWTYSRIPLWICGTLKWGWAQAPTSILLDGCQVRVRLTCRRTAWVCSQRSMGPVAFVRPFMLVWSCLATSYSWGTRSGLRLRLLSLPPRGLRRRVWQLAPGSTKAVRVAL